MIFTSNTPSSQYYAAPDYVDNPRDVRRLAMAGYKPTGEQNAFGKIASWIPGINLAQNAMAQKYARGSEDAMHNIGEDWDNRVAKTAIVGGVAMGVAGGVTGNPMLLQKGLDLTTQFAGQLAFDQNDLVTEGQAIYR